MRGQVRLQKAQAARNRSPAAVSRLRSTGQHCMHISMAAPLRMAWQMPPRFKNDGGPLKACLPPSWDVDEVLGALRWCGAVPGGEGANVTLADIPWCGVRSALLGTPIFQQETAGPAPTLEECKEVCAQAGIGIADASKGSFQSLGAWAMDVAWTEINVRAGVTRASVQYTAIGNEDFQRLEPGGTLPFGFTRPDRVGNLYETAATVWLLRRDLVPIRRLLRALAAQAGIQERLQAWEDPMLSPRRPWERPSLRPITPPRGRPWEAPRARLKTAFIVSATGTLHARMLAIMRCSYDPPC